MVDVGIIGAGVIGLSIARELAGRGMTVRVIGREPPRGTTSWAASGIFPPAPDWPDADPGDRLTAASDRLHRQWHAELLEETGIDNGLAACGGLYLAVHQAGLERLTAEAAAWQARGTRCDWLTAEELRKQEPELATAAAGGLLLGSLLLPEETQIRPPRHLQALEASCRQRGVEILSGVAIDHIDRDDDRIRAVSAGRDTYTAGIWVLAAGAWSNRFAELFGPAIRPRPVRGQIALLKMPGQLLRQIINVGLEYLVPRPDGRVLVGSTLEDAGFAAGTTEPAIERMLRFARHLVPALSAAELETTWSGLRPGSPDGLPWIGRSPLASNGFVATGHFRAGWHQSTGTAVLTADLITGAAPLLDPAAFAITRPLVGDDFVAATMRRAENDMQTVHW
jgi:glycine oxidase